MPGLNISLRQKQTLQFIYESLINEGFPPSFTELKERLGISSNQTLLDLLELLEKKGFIKRDEGARAIRILEKGFSILKTSPLIPFVGTTSAGYFLESPEVLGEWQILSKDLMKFSGETFLVKVNGDSMTNAGIYDGDIVVVQKSKEFKSGDIVLARNGDETTIKRFVIENDSPFLKPESSNPEHKPIPIYTSAVHQDDFEFIGKVIAVFNNLTQPPKIL